MFALGLWDVPSFRVAETADRRWAVQEALLGSAQTARPAGQY
jgi:hypothetical protein